MLLRPISPLKVDSAHLHWCLLKWSQMLQKKKLSCQSLLILSGLGVENIFYWLHATCTRRSQRWHGFRSLVKIFTQYRKFCRYNFSKNMFIWYFWEFYEKKILSAKTPAYKINIIWRLQLTLEEVPLTTSLGLLHNIIKKNCTNFSIDAIL